MGVRFGIHYKPKGFSGKQAYYDQMRWRLKQQERNRSNLDNNLNNANALVGNALGTIVDNSAEATMNITSARIQAEIKAKIADRTKSAGVDKKA